MSGTEILLFGWQITNSVRCGMSYRGPTERPIARALAGIRCLQMVPMRRWTLPVLFSLFLGLVLVISPTVSQEVRSPKNVLVLNSFTNRDSFMELEPFKATLRTHLSMPVNFNVEYLESTRFDD